MPEERPCCRSIVRVRCGRAPSIDPGSDEPLAASTGRIDHRHPTPVPPGDRRIGKEPAHLRMASVECRVDGLAILPKPQITLVGREQDEPTDDASRLPSQPTSDGHRAAFIPIELPFDRAEIVDAGLDLDQEKRPGGRMEREEIDPAMRPTLDDLELAGRLPAAVCQAAVDVPGTTSMNEIALASVAVNDRRPKNDLQLQVQCPGKTDHDVERGVRSTVLDLPHIRGRKAGRSSEGSQRHPEGKPSRATSGGDGNANRESSRGGLVHLAIQANPA